MKSYMIAALLLLSIVAVAPSASAAPEVGKCVTYIDDITADGGSTYCILTNGCVVWESRESFYDRTYHCHVPY